MSSSHKSVLLATGLMLFALFFGAGNLIFPADLGQQAGSAYTPAIIGFLLTGAGLPLLGIMAIGYSGSRDVQDLASRVTPWYGVLFAALLYLSIGPLFAIPRTATVSYEIGFKPFLAGDGNAVALALFSVVFFVVSYWLAMSPSKLVDRIGKVLTPILLVSIAILVLYAAAHPIGAMQAPQGHYASSPLAEGILQGYNTMDALASLVFAIIVIDNVRAMGVSDKKRVMRMTFVAGFIAALCLALVYIFVGLMGAHSVAGLGYLNNGAAVLSQSAQHYFGATGKYLLAVIVFLACLTTSVGLITSCAEYFNRLLPKLSYKAWAIVFTIASCLLANKGLAGIIKFSIPMLMLLYPLTMVIIALAFLHRFFGGHKRVYQCAIFFTVVVGLMNAFQVAFPDAAWVKGMVAGADSVLPFYGIGLGWVLPAFVGFVVGLIWAAKDKIKKPKAS